MSTVTNAWISAFMITRTQRIGTICTYFLPARIGDFTIVAGAISTTEARLPMLESYPAVGAICIAEVARILRETAAADSQSSRPWDEVWVVAERF